MRPSRHNGLVISGPGPRLMHDDEVPIDEALVRALLREQFPDWAGLDVRRVSSSGTDHAMFRLGERLAVRLPRIHWAVATLEREHRWLPVLAPDLPALAPVPLALGQPGCGFPWVWTVCRWVEGSNPIVGELADPLGLAADLGEFVAAFHRASTSDAPPTVWNRPLHEEHHRVRETLPMIGDRLDADAVQHAWDVARAAVPCRRRTWIHGDLAPGNLLVRDGRLHGVIDFSAMGLGDPASDLRVGWNLLPPAARAALRGRLAVDDDTWARGRGWVLLQALAQLPYYSTRNPVLAANAWHVLEQIVNEVHSGAL